MEEHEVVIGSRIGVSPRLDDWVEEIGNPVLGYPELTSNAKFVLDRRILLRDMTGTVMEDFDGLCKRVSEAVALAYPEDVRSKYERVFFDAIRHLDFMPNSPCLTNAGKPRSSLSACFVLPCDDSIESIFDTVKNAALVHKCGGGTGFSGARLRPRGSIVGSTGGVASGPVSLLFQVVNDATEQIKQGCFTADTLVLTRHGLVPITQVVPVADEVWTHLGWQTVTHTFQHGLKKFLKVRLETGQVVRLTPEHKVARLRGTSIELVPMGEVGVGEKLLLLLGTGDSGDEVDLLPHTYEPSKFASTTNYAVRFPVQLDADCAYLLGYYFGNGSNLEAGGISLSVPDDRPLVLDRLVRVAGETFGVAPRVTQGSGACQNIVLHSVVLSNWLQTNQLDKGLSADIQVPEVFYRASTDLTAAFVAGYFDADGYDSGKKKGYVFSSVSEAMLLGVQHLLLAAGIASRLSVEQREGAARDLFSLAVTGREFRTRFFSWVQGQSLKAVEPVVPVKDFGYHYTHETVAALGLPYCLLRGLWGSNNPSGMSYSALCRLRDRLRAEGHPALGRVDELLRLLPATVVSKDDAGEHEAFDLEVDGAHLLSGGGLYASNSTRRGANMGILPIWHPDVLHFIRYKIQDGRLKNFNISVAVTDEFMRDLETDPNGPHLCRFNGKQYWVDKDANSHLMTEDEDPPAEAVSVRQLWNEITRNAHRNGEPGLLFVNECNRKNAALVDPTNEKDPNFIECCNPCCSGDTLVLTRQGFRRIDALVGRPVEVWNGEVWSRVEPFVIKNPQPMLQVVLSTGAVARFTLDHRFYLADGSQVRAGELQVGDTLEKLGFSLPTEGGVAFADAYLAGFYQGDGFFNVEKQKQMIHFYGDAKMAVGRSLEGPSLRLHHYTESCDRQQGVLQVQVPEKGEVPLEWDRASSLEFVAGLLDSDGNVVFTGDNYGYQVSSINQGFLQRFQLLLRQLGVPSVVSLMKAAETKVMPGGEYECQDCWRLSISASSVVRLTEMGLRVRRLPQGPNHPQREALRFPVVTSVFPDGQEEQVYCFTEPLAHRGVFNGMLTGQCGEEPLAPYDACCLGSLNLAHFIRTNGKTELNVDKLDQRVRQAVRFLNGVLAVNYYPVPEIYEATRRNRKIGLGVMGWSDLLMLLGVPYTDSKAWKFATDIVQMISASAWDESFCLAGEIGAYPGFGNGEAFLRVHPELKLLVDKYGHGPANMAITSIAPTGTISSIAGCSSGVEPVFSWAFVQRRIDTESAQLHPLVEDVLGRDYCVELRVLAAEEYPKDVVKQVGFMNLKMLPLMRARGPQFVIARDVPVQAHLEHQAAWQKHITDAVSKTIVFPHEAKLEEVEKAYTWAWKAGLKGLTVYREGSREGEVLSTGLAALKDGEGDKDSPTKRPEVLPALVIRDKVEVAPGEYQNVYVTVGMRGAVIEGGVPFEIFMAGDPKADPRVAQSIDSITRMASTALRYGTPPNVIVQQLERVRGQHMFSMPRKVAQALLRAMECTEDVPEDQARILDSCIELVSGKVCGGQLTFSEGCYKCTRCHSSKCG